MKRIVTCLRGASRKRLLVGVLLLPLAAIAFSQDDGAGTTRVDHVYTQPELDQLLAPVALYPDSLLSQILIAATYPLEIVEAARWSKANPQLNGAAAVQAVDDRDWDPSVKSLIAFPQILAMMDAKLDWTERVGDAFLAQESDVMDEVQSLRTRAYSAGNLASSEHQRVEHQGDSIVIEPSDPAVVYVPYYDPAVVYGPWWWPSYPPVYWGPWPGYYVSPGFVGITWAIGIGVGVNFFFGAWDWPHHHVRVVHAPPFYYRRVHPLPPGEIWRHDPYHRRGVPYRNPSVGERFGRVVPSPEGRRDFRGYVPHAPGEIRPNTPAIRPAPRVPVRPAPPVAPVRPVPGAPPSTPRSPAPPHVEPRPHAFEGVGQGGDVRRYSERGHVSAPPASPGAQRAPAPAAPRAAPAPNAPPGGGAGRHR